MASHDALTVSGLSVCFGSLIAVDKVDLSIPWGKVTALIGPNGAGKTTLFNAISGFLRPASGEIYFKGKNITAINPARLARYGVVRSFQEVRLFAGMTVRENLRVSIDGTRNRGRNRNEDSILEIIGLRDASRKLAGELSYAEQKFVSFGRLLAASPDVFLLDEPSSGLDAVSAQRFAGMVRALVSPEVAVVLVEHNLEMVRLAADDAVFMNLGRIIASGATRDVLRDPKLVEIYLGVPIE